MCCGGEEGEGGGATSLEHPDTLGHVPQVEGIGVPALIVLADLVDLHHAPQLGQVASDQVEEGQLVVILGLLVAVLHNLVQIQVRV